MQGIIVFAMGNLLQNQSHRILAALSVSKTGDKNADGYSIPYGLLLLAACCCCSSCSSVL